MGTGSEVSIAPDAGIRTAQEGIAVRVVSMPSWGLFDKQPEDCRESVLPSALTGHVAVEAGVGLGWERCDRLKGAVVGVDTFGAGVPGEVVYREFGITAEEIIRQARTVMSAPVFDPSQTNREGNVQLLNKSGSRSLLGSSFHTRPTDLSLRGLIEKISAHPDWHAL